jgi:hypothetical protein
VCCRYKGTTIQVGLGASRNTWESWKNGVNEEELQDELLEYVISQTGAVPNEDHWRAKMIKKLRSTINREANATRYAVKRELEQQRSQLGALQQSMHTIQASMQTLTAQHDASSALKPPA